MKPGWKFLILFQFAAILFLVGVSAILLVNIQDLQISRNKQWNYIHAHERLWCKQTTFNREYYHKTHQYKRADKEWPLNAQKASRSED